jgi:hypothetical protein
LGGGGVSGDRGCHMNHRYRIDLMVASPTDTREGGKLEEIEGRNKENKLIKTLTQVLTKSETSFGYLTVSDMVNLSCACKELKALDTKNKLIKKVVRFGNLDDHIRKKFWIQ